MKSPLVFDNSPQFPFQLSYLWDFFVEISCGIPINGMAPAIVTWESVSRWAELMGVELEPWEVRELVSLGNLRAGVQSEKTVTAPKQ